MKKLIRNLLSTMPLGARLLLLAYALGFPLAMLGEKTQAFSLHQWLAFSPPLVWKGQLWRLFTYGFLAAGPGNSRCQL